MMRHIATVTVNPAIDETVLLERLCPGHVHRAAGVRFDVGGKGVNVAACLADFGLKPVVTGYLGADNARIFEQLFKARGIDDRFVRYEGATRTNIKIVDEKGTTDINLAGNPVNAEKENELLCVLDGFASPQWLVIMSGSLAPQMPVDYYVQTSARLKAKGASVIVDCSGEALQALLGAQTLPYAIKPNENELSQWAGRALKTVDDILPVARALNIKGLKLVTVSMGANGALFVTKDKAVHAALKAKAVESTVGAGDAMVAGIAAAICEGGDLNRIARLSTAFAVGRLSQKGPALPGKQEIENLAAAVVVHDLK